MKFGNQAEGQNNSYGEMMEKIQRIIDLGGNDEEFGDITRIQAAVAEQKMLPAQACVELSKILERKMDYH